MPVNALLSHCAQPGETMQQRITNSAPNSLPLRREIISLRSSCSRANTLSCIRPPHDRLVALPHRRFAALRFCIR